LNAGPGLTANTTALNAAFAGSAQNPANYRLVGLGNDGFFTAGVDSEIDLSTSTFVYDAGADQLAITLLNAGGSPIQLPNDNYQFTINGTTSVQDIAGNSILGGNFVQSFVVAVPPPRVIGIRTEGTKKVIQRVFVTFSDPMGPSADVDANYELRDAGKNRVFGDGDDKIIPLSQAMCTTATTDCTEVVVEALRGFSRKRPIRFTARAALRDVGGTPLDGNGDGVPGDNFVTTIAPSSGRRRTQVAASVVDRVLDAGIIEPTAGRQADQQASVVDLVDASSKQSGRGRHVGQEAQFVDSLLNAGEDAGTMWADMIVDVLRRKK
jgi:hypothetical protein